MATYTLSLNFFENLQQDEISYIGDIIYCFTNSMNTAKIAVDKDNVILEKYKEINKFPEFINSWLNFISFKSSACVERCNIDISAIHDSDEMCLALCGAINGCRKLIVYSASSFSKNIDENGCIEYNGTNISVIDKDEATIEINKHVNNIYISNSIVAGNNVEKSKNESYEK